MRLSGFARRHLGRMGRRRRGVMAHLADPDRREPAHADLRPAPRHEPLQPALQDVRPVGRHRHLPRAGGATAPPTASRERARIRELIGLRRQLGLADYVRLLDELAPHKPIISLFGGEPFLYPDIMPLIRDDQGARPTCTVITNGWRLERYARELVELGIDSIAVSIDGPPDVHDRIRGTRAASRSAAAGIRAVARWRRELGRALPVQMAILPVTELNVDAIGAAVEALRALPLDTSTSACAGSSRRRWARTTSASCARPSASRRRPGRASSSPGRRRRDAGAAMTDLVSARRPAPAPPGRLDRGRPWTSFVPGRPRRATSRRTSRSRRATFGHDLCPVAWYFAQVEPDGDVCFCGDFPDYFIGNVRKRAVPRRSGRARRRARSARSSRGSRSRSAPAAAATSSTASWETPGRGGRDAKRAP